MKAILNVYVNSEDKDFCILTHHPKWEAMHAKRFCDKIAEEGGVHSIETISTDATSVYWEYGKFVKDIDVHLFLNDKESSIEKIFENYNTSFEYTDSIITEDAHKKIDEYYDNLKE